MGLQLPELGNIMTFSLLTVAVEILQICDGIGGAWMKRFGKKILVALVFLLTLAVALFFGAALYYMIANGYLDIRSSSSLVRIGLLIFCIACSILSLFKPRAGGAAMIVSGLLLGAYMLFRADQFTAVIYGLPFVAVGALHFLLPKRRK